MPPAVRASNLSSAAILSGLVGALACSLALGSGCEGDIGDDGTNDIPGPPDVEPEHVPASLEKVSSTSTCTSLQAGERLVSVSPEGHAWLVREGSPSHVRVLDAFGDELAIEERDLEVGDIADAQAFSGSDAALVGSSLFRLTDFARIELGAPEGFQSPATLCGDPSDDGVLLSAGSVFEAHADAWMVWSPGGEAETVPTRAVRHEGACRGTKDSLWLTSEDGTLYRVDGAQFATPIRFDGLVDAAATDEALAVLDGGGLWIQSGDDTWSAWVFDGGTPETLTAVGSTLYLGAGSKLLRYDGAAWEEIETDLGQPIRAVAAHANGVFVIGDDTICHQSFGAGIRVGGVTPFSQSKDLERTFTVEASDGSEDVSATVDGETIDLGTDEETGLPFATARLEAIGWHTIELTSATSGARRTLHLKRAPETERRFEADIAPIYQANCATAGCHTKDSTDPPDLSTYASWTANADLIRTRVVEGKTMPPAANVGPDWGEDDIKTIQEWLEGGMLP